MKALIFDTETTGLVENSGMELSKQPQVIEFYGTVIDTDKDYEEVAVLEFLANPGKPLPEVIKKITGIDDALLKDAKKFSDYVGPIGALFAKADACVAHNLSYDKQLMDFEMQRLKLVMPWPAKLICTVEATIHIKRHRLNLAKLYEHLFPGETFPGAHRAKADVMALKRCFIELHKKGLV